jgi:hypothetical protein
MAKIKKELGVSSDVEVISTEVVENDGVEQIKVVYSDDTVEYINL